MSEKYGDFVIKFFEKIGCSVNKGDGFYVVDNVPSSFSDLALIKGPYKICFDKKKRGMFVCFSFFFNWCCN